MIAKWVIVFFPILPVLYAWYFYHKQNKSKNVGGAISGPKSLWLGYALTAWFILPIFFLFLDAHAVYTYLLVIHLVSWWTRGILELVMMYRWFNWSPIYGITHDLCHFAILLIGLLGFALYFPEAKTGLVNLIILAYLTSLTLAMLFETYFAYVFLKIRGPNDHKTYFANNDPRWKSVNMITTLANVLFYGHLLLQSALLIYNY